MRIGIATPEYVCKTGVRVPECRRFEHRCLDPSDRRGPHPRRREPDAGPIASYRSGGRRRGPRNRGFTVAAEAADTVREGHAEAGHDQSGNVGGRESTVPRFENPNRPARQAVPPLRQARRVLHALYLEAAGQPGTAPRPLLPVPPRGARRFAELPRPRLVGRTTAFSRGTTVGQAVTSASPAAASPSGSSASRAGPGGPRRRRQRSTKAPCSPASRRISSAETGCIALAASGPTVAQAEDDQTAGYR